MDTDTPGKAPVIYDWIFGSMMIVAFLFMLAGLWELFHLELMRAFICAFLVMASTAAGTTPGWLYESRRPRTIKYMRLPGGDYVDPGPLSLNRGV